MTRHTSAAPSATAPGRRLLAALLGAGLAVGTVTPALADPPPPAYAFDQVSGLGVDHGQNVYPYVPGVSADGARVLFSGFTGSTGPYLMLRDRTAGTTVLLEEPDDPDRPRYTPEDPTLSADGTTVAYLRRPADGGPREVFLTDPAGTTQRPVPVPAELAGDIREVELSGDAGTLTALVWPDLTRGEEHPVTRLVGLDLATGAAVHRVDLPWVDVHDVVVSEDAGRVALVAATDDGDVLQVLDAATGDVVASFTDWGGQSPALDGTGSTLAYRTTGNALVVVDLADGARHEAELPEDVVPHRPTISADGSTIAYATDALGEGGRSSTAPRVFTAPSHGGAPVLVAGGGETTDPQGAEAGAPALSADGRTVVVWIDGRLVAATPRTGGEDQEPPAWPAGATLTATPGQDGTIGLSWPAAADRSLAAYELTVDGAPLATVGADRTRHEVPGDDAEHTYAVTARDASGNRGAALTATARTLARLTAEADGPGALRLTLPTTTDPTVTGLRVLRAALGRAADRPTADPAALQQVADLPAGTTRWSDPGLDQLGWYAYRVDGITADGTTRPLSRIEVAATTAPDPGALTVSAITSTGAQLSWASASDSLPLAGYRLERRQTAPNTTEWEVVGHPTGTSTTDRGLEPGHAYAWRVVAELDGGWPERPWTTEATATLQRQGVADLEVGVQRIPGTAALQLGSQLTVRATDETGMTGSVRLTQGRGAGATHVDLPLTEVEPGRYATAPYRLDGRELTAIDDLVVSLTDGTRTDTGQVRDVGVVGSRLQVTVAPGVDLTGAVLRSPGARPVSAPGTVAVDVVPGTVDLDLLLPDGDVVAAQRLEVPAGSELPVTLTPVRHSVLHVALSATGTVQPGSLTVTGADGQLLVSRSFPGGAREVVVPGLPSGTDVVVATRLADRTSRTTQPSAVVTLAGGRVDAALRQEPLPVADLAVTATGLGAPLASGTVTVTQEVDGRTFTSTAAIAAGTATVRALAGPASARVESPFHVATGQSLPLPGALTVDLVREPTYRIRPHLLTTNTGSATVEQPMDWITGAHFRLQLTGAGSPMTPAAEVPFAGQPGDVVRLCGDGAEAGLSSGCVELVLGEDRDVDLTLALEQKGAATARVVGTDGRPVTWWQADVVRVGADGDELFRRSVGRRYGTGADARLSLPETGRYEVTWTSLATGSAHSTVDVVDGTPVDLGTVALVEDSWVASLPSVTPSVLLPGGTAVIRVTVPARTSASTVAWVDLDEGITHVPGTALSAGVPVASTVVDGAVRIPLTTASPTVVRIPVQVAADAADGQRSARVAVESGPANEGYVPTAYYEVRAARITGPATVTTPTVPVSGEAPAGSPVVVRDSGGRTVGTATAGPGGRWSAQVQLYNPAPRREQRLVATVGEGATASLSAPYTVTYDPQFVQAELITVTPTDAAGQQTRREISFDPRQGVATMTMIYVPHERMRVSARFADAGRVHGFTAHVGALSATGSCTATTCVAWLPAGSAAQTGDIWVDHDVDAVPTTSWADVPVGDEDSRRNALPVDWRDPQLSARNGTTTTVTVAGGIEVTAEVTARRVPLGEPSRADTALQQATGIPVQGFSVTGTETDGGMTLQVSAGLPETWVTATPEQRANGQLGTGRWLVVSQVLFTIKALGSFDGDVRNLFVGSDEEKALDDLRRYVLERVAPCAPAQAQQLLGQILYSRASVAYYRASNTAMGLLGLLGGAYAEAWAEVGVVISEVTQAGVDAAIGETFELLANKMISDEMEGITTEVRGAPLCNPDLDTLPLFWQPPAGRPHWIYDPSGTVYEALAAQPLAGVTATVYSGASANGPWTVWDASAYGQTNPQPTTATGYYGWDVPRGWWRVEYSAPGYRTQTSAPMQVLPEHYGVDADLHRLAAPALSTASFTAAGALAVEFDQWMSVDSVRAGLSLQLGSATVAGTLAATGAQRAPDGVLLARQFTFTPTSPLPSQAPVRLLVAGTTVDHGDVALGADATRDLRAPARPDAPVACGPVGLTVNPTSRVAPGAVVSATVTAPAGAPVQLRGITAYSVLDWLRAVLTGQGAGARPSVVLAEGRADARGQVVLTFRATRDVLVLAQQPRCPSTSRLVVVDVR